MTVQPVMAAERTVFYRERAASYYSAAPYTMVWGQPGRALWELLWSTADVMLWR